MVKRCIGIDLGRTCVRAMQMVRTPEGLFIEKAFGMQTRRSSDSLPGILQSLATEHGFDRHAEVAVAMPSQAVSFVEIQTDAPGLQAVRAGQTLELRNDLPIAVEDAIVQVCSTRTMPNGKFGVLLAATSAESIREHLQSLREAGIRPVVMDTSIVATLASLVVNHPEAAIGTALILCVEESLLTLAVSRDANLLIVRNIPVFCDEGAELSVEQIAEIVEREVEITWQRLFGAAPDASLCILLVSAPKAAEPLTAAIRERIECRIVAADPYANVKRSGNPTDGDFSLCAAEGLVLQAMAPALADRTDFLAAYNARMRPGGSIRRELMACAALIVITAAVWFLGLFVRLSALEAEYGRLKSQIHTVFLQALPQERNVVDPLAQLQQKIDAFHNESEAFSSFRPGRLSPLEVMHVLTTRAPKEGTLKFRDLLITADSVQAVGTCDSFAVISEWQRLLQQAPGFDAVNIQDQKKDAGTGQVQFTLSMTSARRNL